MRENLDQGENLPPYQRLLRDKDLAARYLKSYPENYNLASIYQFVENGKKLYVDILCASFGIKSSGQEKALKSEIERLLGKKEDFRKGALGKESFKREEASISFDFTPKLRFRETPNKFFGVIYQSSFVSDLVPRFEYAWLLSDKHKNNDPKISTQDELMDLKGKYSYLNWRYVNLKNVCEENYSREQSQLLSLVTLEELSRRRTISLIKDSLHRHDIYHPTTIVYPPEGLLEAANYTKRMLSSFNFNLGYLTNLTVIIDKFVKQNNFTGEQVNLFREIISMKKGELVSGEYTKLITPVSRFISVGNYEQALIHQAFIKDNFAESFPKWMRQEKGLSLKSIEDVAKSTFTQGKKGITLPEMYKDEVEQKIKEMKRQQLIDELNQIKEKELRRKQKIGTDLMLRSIGMMALQSGCLNYDLDLPISESNMLKVCYPKTIPKMNKIPKGKDYYFNDVIMEDGIIKYLIIANSYWSKKRDYKGYSDVATSPRTIFYHLVFQQRMTAEIVEEAFKDLVSFKMTKEEDKIVPILKSVDPGYLEYLKQPDEHPQSEENKIAKRDLINKFFKEFKD